MARVGIEIVPVTAFQQNCAILHDADAKQGTVIDPGGDVDAIMAALDRLGVEADQIVLTHGHIDHAGGAAELKQRLGGVPVIGPHKADSMLLAVLEQQGAAMGIPARPIAPDRWLDEGDTVRLGGADFAVLHCPGHTPGHVAFYSQAMRFAVLGDVLFHGSIGRTDFPYGDHAALIASINDKVLPLGDDVRFICGHGPGSSIGAERRGNPFLR